MQKIINKQNQITATAQSLFWKYGMRRVSIEEICREAKVSKMTFYKFFKNKVDLVKYILDKITNESTETYQAIMNQDIPFYKKVIQTIDMKLKSVDQISPEFYADLHQKAVPEISEHFHNISHKVLEMIVNDYKKAQEEGEIRSDLKLEFIIYQLNKIFEMAGDPKLIAMYKTPKDVIMELTRFFFYGILPRENE
ncbi:MAG: TetR/AcrR family transcriptional regulator [Calditrichaceae bacterium]|nr:TetR/AcrR family transcriptional regulator [Calditrichaceae bacterium]